MNLNALLDLYLNEGEFLFIDPPPPSEYPAMFKIPLIMGGGISPARTHYEIRYQAASIVNDRIERET